MTRRGKSRGVRPRWRLVAAGVLAVTLVSATVGLVLKARLSAHELITNPLETRRLPGQRPIDYGLVYDEVSVRTSDGLALAGWYVPGTNGAVVLAQHGYKSSRGEMLNEAAMLHRHGYGVIITSIRAHDLSDGTLITFGGREREDLAAWFRFAREQANVDPRRIAILGNSLGGSIAIEFAAATPSVAAVIANSAFSSLRDTLEKSLRFYTGLPPFPFVPLVTFWAEREGNFSASEIDARRVIGRLSPRPVLLMQGGGDVVISVESGARLYAAAGSPKELWFEPKVGHSGFDTAMPDEYERRVVAFLDRHLTVP